MKIPKSICFHEGFTRTLLVPTLTVFVLSITGYSDERTSEGINFFEGTFTAALAEASKQELPVFAYFYSQTCGACKVMKNTVFPIREVGEFVNARFVSFRIDVENEQVGGPKLMEEYNVGSYPTYLILNDQGDELHRATSSMSADHFIRMISHLIGESESSMEAYLTRYQAGERDPDFVQELLLESVIELSLMPKDTENWEANMEAYTAARDKYRAIADEYLHSKKEADLINSKDLSIIGRNFGSRGEPWIEFVFNNFDDYLKVIPIERLARFVLVVTADSAFMLAMNGDPTYVELIDELDREPLNQAVTYESTRDADSVLLPEFQRKDLREVFLMATESELDSSEVEAEN